MKTDETKTVKMANLKETLLHSLYIMLIEFRAYSTDDTIKEIANLFHNVPLMLKTDEVGTETMKIFKERLLNGGYSEEIKNKYKNLGSN